MKFIDQRVAVEVGMLERREAAARLAHRLAHASMYSEQLVERPRQPEVAQHLGEQTLESTVRYEDQSTDLPQQL